MATFTVKVSDEAGTAVHEVRVDAANAADACDLAALDLRGSGVGGPVPVPPDELPSLAAERESSFPRTRLIDTSGENS